MKILWCFNGVVNSGYWVATRNYLLAMEKSGLDVVLRVIGEQPTDLKHLIEKSQYGCDILIIHGLPISFRFDGRFKKCIGLFAWETDKICSSWTKCCNQMDEVWVVNQQQRQACADSGVTRRIRVVPHTEDINKYLQIYHSKHPIIQKIKANDNYKFYSIGEFIKRKNYGALLKAWYLEFDPAEPVELVIKTSKEGINSQECLGRFLQLNKEIKENLKLYGNNLAIYKDPLVITERFNENDLNALHQACDCFVQPSMGEAWSQSCYDALGFIKTPIATNCTGYMDYISSLNGYLVECRKEPCCGVVDTFPDIYSGRENWWSVDIQHLRKQMRLAYQSKKGIVRDNFNKESFKTIAEFSYEKVGNLIKKYLEA